VAGKSNKGANVMNEGKLKVSGGKVGALEVRQHLKTTRIPFFQCLF